MTEFQFGTYKLPPEVKSLHSSEVKLSEADLSNLIQAAVLHLDGRTEEACRRYGAVAGRPAAVYGGLLSLLRAGRALPPTRRRADTLTDALRRCRVPESWQPALVAAMCAAPSLSTGTSAGPVHWSLDVVIADSERGQVLEPSVGLKVPRDDGGDICLQLPKAQFLRFRQEMAVARRELEIAQSRYSARPA